MTRPDDYIWRSPAAPALEAAGATFTALSDAAIAESVRGGTQETAGIVGLADLSPLPRIGFKGAGAFDWLAAVGLPAPDPNRWAAAADGLTIARLGPTEALIYAGQGQGLEALVERHAKDAPGLCFAVPRRDSHIWYRLTGQRAHELMARLCGVDLRPHVFPPDGVAQTSVARLSAVVVRDDIGDLPAFHLFADFASGAYLWQVLSRTASELGGGPIGGATLREIAGSSTGSSTGSSAGSSFEPGARG